MSFINLDRANSQNGVCDFLFKVCQIQIIFKI